MAHEVKSPYPLPSPATPKAIIVNSMLYNPPDFFYTTHMHTHISLQPASVLIWCLYNTALVKYFDITPLILCVCEHVCWYTEHMCVCVYIMHIQVLIYIYIHVQIFKNENGLWNVLFSNFFCNLLFFLLTYKYILANFKSQTISLHLFLFNSCITSLKGI